MVRCYRLQPASEDPRQLLNEEAQRTEPWGGSEDGERCDKCKGVGRTSYECWSCLLAGTDASCPACHGRVRWEGECPVCRGTGEVDGEPRHGVSAFPKAEGLYRYVMTTDADTVGTLVELEAELAEEVDFDADQGVILVIPTAIVHTRPMEPDAIDTIRALAEGNAQR